MSLSPLKTLVIVPAWDKHHIPKINITDVSLRQSLLLPVQHPHWGVGNNELWKCQSDIWPKCAQKRYINTCERKKESHHIIYSRATPLIYIVMNREKEEEEEAPILYYGKGRVGTTINDKISWTFPSSSQVVLWLRMVWWYVRLAFPK